MRTGSAGTTHRPDACAAFSLITQGIWAAVGSIVLLLVLFVGTTAFAVNERFKREVAEIAYNRDLRGLNFLLEQEAASLEEISDTVAALDSKVSTVAVEDRALPGRLAG